MVPERGEPAEESPAPAAGVDPTVAGVDSAVAEGTGAAAPGSATGRGSRPGPPATSAGGSGLPRWLLLLIGAATATIAVAGLKEIAWLAGPVLLALVVVIAVEPVQQFLLRHGWPRWAAATVLLLIVWTVLLGFLGLLVLSAAQLAVLLPDYTGPAEALLSGVVDTLNNAGLVSGQLSDLVSRIDYGQFVGMATGLAGRITEAASTVVLLLAALIFIGAESGGFARRLVAVTAERPHLPIALGMFARGTRTYLFVSTVFGGIVAVGDTIGLALLGVPAAALWGVLSFITNYVPNIGFVLGLLPPALLGLLAGGWGKFAAIVVLYSVLNFVIQTLIQPRFVGDSVGLSMTVTFVALLFWGWVLGALGALLAIPLTLLVKALVVDVDPRLHWLDVLVREEPRSPRTARARQRARTRRAALASVRALDPQRGGDAH